MIVEFIPNSSQSVVFYWGHCCCDSVCEVTQIWKLYAPHFQVEGVSLKSGSWLQRYSDFQLGLSFWNILYWKLPFYIPIPFHNSFQWVEKRCSCVDWCGKRRSPVPCNNQLGAWSCSWRHMQIYMLHWVHYMSESKESFGGRNSDVAWLGHTRWGAGSMVKSTLS